MIWRSSSSFHPQRFAATLGEVAHDVAHEILGGADLDRHHRLEHGSGRPSTWRP